MKKKISLTLSLALLLSLVLIVFTACGDKNNGEKQVPVYQGMTITKSNASTLSLTSAHYRSGGVMLLSANKENNGDNGNHNGHYKGDHTDRNDMIDEENPYPDNDKNENIEEEIKSSFNVIGSPDTIYYATPNQDIYINIHIDNPDSFEIMSFTLNGKKYSSYMFEEGSDMETIVLKYNVGSASGIVEYTIDAIKYIDGTDIKDVIIDGNKTVMAGVKTENQLVTSVSGVDIDTNALSFNVNIKDNDNLIAFSGGVLKAVIYDGFEIVAEKDLALGENSISFDSLKTNTLYQYAVISYYDDLSGDGFKMNVLYKDAFYTDSVVLFDNIAVEQECVSFGLLWHEDHAKKTISALKLYQGDKLIQTLSANTASVENLLSNNTYKLVAEYLNEENTESIYLEFTTLAKATPEISLINSAKTQTSVGFEINETDTDNVGAVTKIELTHANGTVVADSLDQRTFANLLSNNTYTVKVTYVYNLNDGEGEHTVTKNLAISTDAKTAPSFTVKNENITTEIINAEYDINDVDNILSHYKVELYKGNTLVSENTDKEIAFEGLNYYIDYTVKITYMYDLNDGNGNQIATCSYTFKTLPYIDVTECNIANTSAVSEGETIFMSVKLDNPLGMTIESVVINGETYNVTGGSTSNRIFVEIVYNGQFAGGDTYLKIDKVNARIDSTTLSVEPVSELSDNVFINGKLEVLKIEFVNEDFEPIDWAFPSEKVYVMITLNNSTGYNIDSITESGSKSQGMVTDLEKLDDNHWYYELDFVRWEDGVPFYDTSYDVVGWFTKTLESLSYSNDYIAKTVTYSEMKALFYRLTSDEIHYITSPDDLKSMNGKRYYELANDIDLAGLEWLGVEFDGVFDGKGYSIKNMSFVGTIKNSNALLGLFSVGTGIINNIGFESCNIVAHIVSDDGQSYSAYVGLAVAQGKMLKISSAWNADSYISITNTSTGGAGSNGVIAGGFAGEISNSSIVCNSKNYADISSKAEWGMTGGIVGNASESIVEECCNYGQINSNNNSGGISGGGCTIINSINYGTVFGEFSSGGIAGWGGNDSITNCINVGKILGSSFITAGIAGQRWNSSISNCINLGCIESQNGCAAISGEDNFNVKNCYGIIKYAAYDDVCSVEQLNSEFFYLETLGWSEDIWDFSELDVENGKYPKLKQ